MSEEEILSYVSLLSREPIFQELASQELRWIAEQFEHKTFSKDEIIYEEDTPAEAFYIILAGKVRITEIVRDGEKQRGILNPGEFFGERDLINDQAHSETATVLQDVDLIYLEGLKFFNILDQIPVLKDRLEWIARSQEVGRKSIDPWLQPEEVTLLVVRRHLIFLFTALIFPFLLMSGSLVGLAYGTINGFVIITFLSAFTLFGSLLWAIWVALDWGNDYYIITNKRIIALEKVIGIHQSRREAPLSAVLSTDIYRSFIGQLVNFGDVTVRTFMGNLMLKGADRPDRLTFFIESYKNRVSIITKEQQVQKIGKVVEEAINEYSQPSGKKAGMPVTAPPPTSKSKKPDIIKKTSMVSRSLFRMKFEGEGTVTYRKHWWILFSKIWWLIILLGLVTPIFVWLSFNGAPPVIMCCLGGLVWVVPAWMIFYRIWDWHNDTFQLTSTMILDIEKKPFGAESKKTANLDAPDLRIEHVRPSFLANLLNLGNVTVFIGQSPFVMVGLYDPDEVHQEIASRREALINNKNQSTEDREQERMINWLMAYYAENEKRKNSGNSGNPP